MERRNLWGELDIQPVRTPTSILREQAAFLSQLTHEVLNGEVGQFTYGRGFEIFLYIVAPSLNSYRFEVLRVVHQIEIYPLNVRDIVNEADYECADESQFVDRLGEILSSPKVRKAIATLISQSGAVSPSTPL